ncbi:MAG: cell division protein FtsH, cell division protease FtsH [Candidatus Parcubacteria bacterium]|jgi:cell division protease FtsH
MKERKQSKKQLKKKKVELPIPFLSKKPKGKNTQTPLGNMVNMLIVFLVIASLYGLLVGNTNTKPEQVTMSTLVASIKANEVEKVVVSGEELQITKKGGVKQVAKKEIESSLSQTLSNYGVTPAELSQTIIEVKRDTGPLFWLNLIPIIIPILFIGFFIWWISRQAKSGGAAQAFSFGQSKARIIDPNDASQKVTFADVAGNKEAKIELLEIVDFLKNPQKFLDIGAKIPKGALLFGSPGTGKTLMARAVAGEAGVPFFHLSGSEFVEMFVGVGASRVRDLFAMAKKAAPAIIFIDEIDAVGRVRGVGVGGGNDEREQTLNQILVEMDGFEPSTSVIVMAATNRADVLDPALLRPGRFDRRVTLDLPDRSDREAIMNVHAKKKPFASDVNITTIAERTPGFSGADLESLMNEGAILAARKDRKEITQDDLLRSIEKVMLGPERLSHIMSKEEKRLTAYHEGGHALVASVLEHSDPVHKISIIARGRTGGYTLKLPLDERRLQSKKAFLDDIAVSLGGYVAEEMIMGDVTTGPSNDLQVSSAMAREMVTRYGMSDKFGPIAFEAGKGRTMFGEGVSAEISGDLAKQIDEEVARIMREGYEKTKKVLSEYRVVLDAIAEKLVEVETLEQPEYEQILIAHNIPLKKKVII